MKLLVSRWGIVTPLGWVRFPTVRWGGCGRIGKPAYRPAFDPAAVHRAVENMVESYRRDVDSFMCQSTTTSSFGAWPGAAGRGVARQGAARGCSVAAGHPTTTSHGRAGRCEAGPGVARQGKGAACCGSRPSS
jgi:hypothetical protein